LLSSCSSKSRICALHFLFSLSKASFSVSNLSLFPHSSAFSLWSRSSYKVKSLIFSLCYLASIHSHFGVGNVLNMIYYFNNRKNIVLITKFRNVKQPIEFNFCIYIKVNKNNYQFFLFVTIIVHHRHFGIILVFEILTFINKRPMNHNTHMNHLGTAIVQLQ
jgi:hypothetical protein